jgi:hypothetical protein
MKRKTAAVFTGLVIAGGAAACSGSSGTTGKPLPSASASSPATPSNAVGILKSDGYSPVLNETAAAIKSSFGSTAPYFTSVAVGSNGTGAAEEVLVAGNTVNGVTGSDFLTGLKSQMKTDFPKARVAVAGDVLRITAPTLKDIGG